MNGKVGFWRWLLLKIWKGIKNIPKLIKEDPAFEFTLAIFAFLFGMLLLTFFGYPEVGILVGFAFAFLILAHGIYRMEMEGDC